MANVTTNTYRKIDNGGYYNEMSVQRLVYDFAEDGGATADTYRMAEVTGKIYIVECVLHVITACTSGGSATVSAGAETADADAFGSGIAVGTLVDDYVVKTAAGQNLVVDGSSSTDYLSLTIATAALTAGKIEFVMRYFRID